MIKAKVTLYLDKRRKKKSGKFPLKIRVWDPDTNEAKLYPSGLDLSEKEFQAAWETTKPRKEFRELRNTLDELKVRALEIGQAAKTNIFNEFNRKLYRPKGAGQNVFHHFKETIASLNNEGRIGTASSYSLAEKSLVEFQKSRNRSGTLLQFNKIDPEWLQCYEDYMVGAGRSLGTVGVYLRTLRAVFNRAIELNDIDNGLYPFGRRKYVIPSSRRVKKALSKEQLSGLFRAEAKSEYQEKAKAFFFFSYSCNGMNIKDIAQLKFSDLSEDSFTFYRAKTLRTTKDRLVPITVFFNDFTRDVIQKYGNEPETSSYVFPIINDQDDPIAQKRKTQAFTRFINQHLKKLAATVGLPKNVSTIWARHSFATNAARQGHSMDFMREALGHTDQKTTLNYFAGFENKTKKELAKNLMDF